MVSCEGHSLSRNGTYALRSLLFLFSNAHVCAPSSLLQVHTIAFGHSNIPLLQQMAAEGGGTHHMCQSGVDLASTFVNIAKGCTAVDGLVERFGEILSDAVSLKVMVDYL